MDILGFIIIKNICASKDTTKKVETIHRIGKKYLQSIYLIWDYYLEHKSKLNTPQEKANSKVGNIWVDISLQQIYNDQ